MLAAVLCTPHVGVQSCANWPEWNLFSNRIVQPDGRVIDFSTPALQSTSEDQSYALFFALVANDRASFERVLRWTDADFAAGGAVVSIARRGATRRHSTISARRSRQRTCLQAESTDRSACAWSAGTESSTPRG
ncbi:glycosyl hydrolase family 8 [Mycetohabitans rhizoxinica]|jgi:hypothetical protein|uniref:cellulase n=1 Tax=Mycetohabitans rhizoxinica TaxID=412963 RepID=A0ABZ2Q0B4_9BURK